MRNTIYSPFPHYYTTTALLLPSQYPLKKPDLASQRLPFFIGMSVLLAIVYVLSLSPSSLPTPQSTSPYNLDNVDMGKLREEAFKRTPPHIIECDGATDGGDQSSCHLPRR